jgi:type IV secretion system protein VirD4
MAGAAGDLWEKNDGVYFGYICDRVEGAPPPLDARKIVPYIGDRHLITIGPNGSGKSRRLLLTNLERLIEWSILVIDPKGELAQMTAAHRKKSGRVIILNPFDALGLGSDRFNPVAALDPTSGEFADDALALAEALIRVEGKEPFWPQSAQDLVAALIMYSRLTQEDGGSLRHVRSELGKTAKDFADVVEEMIVTGIDREWEELAIKAARFSGITSDNRELNGIISTALTQTRWLDSRPVKDDLDGQSTNGLRHGDEIDFASMKHYPTTVYLILPARRLGTHSTWLRLMIAAVLGPLMKDTRKSATPVLFMLDEFAQLGHLPIIENNMAMMRGYGVKLWTVLQDLAQANEIYGKRWESFVGNAGVLQSFQPRDVVTTKYLSELSGQSLRSERSFSVTRTPGSKEVASENRAIKESLMAKLLPEDLRNMDEGFSLLYSHRNKGPVQTFLPDPSQLPHMKAICALAP